MAKPLVHMKESAKEAKTSAPMRAPARPGYPWGLSLHLDEASHQKLGVKGPLAAGKEVHLIARAKVRTASESSHDDQKGGKHRSADLQITHLALGGKASKKAAPAGPSKLIAAAFRKGGK